MDAAWGKHHCGGIPWNKNGHSPVSIANVCSEPQDGEHPELSDLTEFLGGNEPALPAWHRDSIVYAQI